MSGQIERPLMLAGGIGGMAVSWFQPTNYIEQMPGWSKEMIGWIGLGLVLLSIFGYIWPKFWSIALRGKKMPDEKKPGEIPDAIKRQPPSPRPLTTIGEGVDASNIEVVHNVVLGEALHVQCGAKVRDVLVAMNRQVSDDATKNESDPPRRAGVPLIRNSGGMTKTLISNCRNDSGEILVNDGTMTDTEVRDSKVGRQDSTDGNEEKDQTWKK